jgi:hypothetical protein
MAAVTRRTLVKTVGAAAGLSAGGVASIRSVAADSQSAADWERTYGDDVGSYAFADVIQTADEGFLAVGKRQDPDRGQAEGWFVKTDATGREMWSDTVSGHDLDDTRFRAVVPAGDGTYRLFGGLSTFDGTRVGGLVVAEDGTVERTWQSDIHGEAYAATLAPDGSTVIAGEAYTSPGEESTGLIAKVTDGELDWVHRVEPDREDANARVNDVIRGSDGGYIATGMTTRDRAAVPLVMKLDARGNTVWTTEDIGDEELERRFEFFGLARAADGGYLAVGEVVEPGEEQPNGHANKFAANGRADWSVNTGEPGVDLEVSAPDGMRDAIGHGDGTFTVAGYHQERGGWVLKVEANGIVAEQAYGESGEFASVLGTAGGDVLLAGSKRTEGKPRGWLALAAVGSVSTIEASQRATSTPASATDGESGTASQANAIDASGTGSDGGGGAPQRGFFSNSGNDPPFLTNVFNLTVLGFLLSIVGIIYQMMEG